MEKEPGMSLIKSINIPLINESEELYAEDFDETVEIIIAWIINEQSSPLIEAWTKRIFDNDLSAAILEYIDSLNSIYNRISLLKTVQEKLIGYGQLQQYIVDDSISDILGTRYDSFYCKRNGVLEELPISFSSEKIFQNFCRLIVIRNGGVINQSDSHERVSDLRYRLRINVTLPPQSVMGASLCIRKHHSEFKSLTELQLLGMLDDSSFEILTTISKSRKNIVLFGRGGAGKTTLLRGIIHEIDPTERVLVMETDPELYPSKQNIIVHKVKKGKENSHSLHQLIKDGLTMSLDTYIVGEIVGGEAFDFIQAGLTDHRILGTLHANDYSDSILRLCSLMSSVSNMPASLLIDMIHKSIDYYVYMKDYKVMSIHMKVIDSNDSVQFTSLYERID